MRDEDRKRVLREKKKDRVAEAQGRYRRLHVCRKLTGNADFHVGGNGLGRSFVNDLVLWFSDERRAGKPDKRTRKAEVSSYLQQDAVDALLALASIAERVAPYAWRANGRPEAPERGWVGCDKKGMKILIDEAGAFIDRFGLPHMRSDGEGPGTRKNPVRTHGIRLTASFKRDHREEMRDRLELLAEAGSEFSRDMFKRELRSKSLYVEGKNDETVKRIFFDGLLSVAKDFKGIDGFSKQRKELEADRERLCAKRSALVDRMHGKEALDEVAYKKLLADEGRICNEIEQLHLDEETLLAAAENAFNGFDEEERGFLFECGYVTPDLGALYGIGLMFRDAIELYLAIGGDEAAFRRVLGKVHMEVFDARLPYGVERSGDADIAISAAEERYTIWFESSGRDYDNPGRNLDDSNVVLDRNEYKAMLHGVPLMLDRKPSKWGDGENYGCGVTVHVLCDRGESPKQFELIAREHLGDFLDGLIAIGVEHNYKGLFAEPADIDRKNPVITVNDFETDLVRTLWSVMDMVRKGEIAMKVSRCKCCGRLINTAREAGNAREFCDSSCRSLHRKRVAAQEKSGKQNPDVELRRRFLEFEESPEAIHIGAVEHMGPEMQPDLDEGLSIFERFERFKRKAGRDMRALRLW